MHLRDFLREDAISLSLTATTKDEVLAELVRLLRLEPAAADALFRLLQRREELGSTGVGRGIAIPHARSFFVDRLRLAFARHATGVNYDAIDGNLVHNFFLIVAPPVEVSNLYLPVLGRIAQFAMEPDVAPRLAQITTPQEFTSLLEEKGV
jgi:mannitol/fructose-specific phosphotransferase system IIA component (Ntr-type)